MTKTILITGAGSGFGKGAAIELASRGHRVFATTETAAQADELGAAHPELTAMKLDITDGQDFIDNKYFWLKKRSYSKR